MKTRPGRILISFVALAAVLFVAWVIRRADAGNIPGVIAAMYSFPNGDKLGHFLLMGALAFILALALPQRYRIPGLTGLALLLGIEEFSQQFFAHRHSSWLDLACSLAGVAVFGGLSIWLTHLLAGSAGIEKKEKGS